MGKYNLWLEWESYKIRHPEMRQVLEWQEQYYKTFCGCPQDGNGATPPGQALKLRRRYKMSEVKYPWVVVVVGDGYAVARNGQDGVPEMGNHYYPEACNAQEEADWLNKAEGITDAPRFD
ncbi:hypothetical protein [Allisonella histaminiformans]|uniref:hypothetical protein n=1 Tax=Allisonella histaminiformans TaxID=209880 RepID=UPI00388D9EBB